MWKRFEIMEDVYRKPKLCVLSLLVDALLSNQKKQWKSWENATDLFENL